MESKRTRIATPKVKKVIDISTKPLIVSGSEVAKALGAEPTGHQMPVHTPPDAQLSLFEAIANEVVSSGGRPGRKGDTERKKIPLTKEEWAQLQALADDCNEYGVSVSPAQLGGLLVREGLRAYQASHNHLEVDELMAAAAGGEALDRLRPIADAVVEELKNRKRGRKETNE